MPKQLKVMYMITNLGFGRGGHFYSLRTTAEALNPIIDPYIVTIGRKNSPVIDSSIVRSQTIKCNGWDFLYTLFVLIRTVKKQKPTVIHSFDSGSFAFARVISYLFKIPLVYTKPGGSNPSGYYPYAKEFILFSNENLNFFKIEEKLKDSKIYLIPNRVSKIKSDQKRIALLKEKIDLTKKTFLRIARFSTAYTESMIQAIDLVSFLNSKGVDSQLILIGIPQNLDAYNEIMDYIDKQENASVYVFTEDEFTVNASEMIDVADCVIGTGRGLMEAASRSKVLFTPVEYTKFPIMITEENFSGLFDTNFSPRNKLVQELINKNETNILSLFESEENILKVHNYSKTIYNKYFNIDTKQEEYYKIYSTVEYDKKIYLFDFLEHFARAMVNFTRDES